MEKLNKYFERWHNGKRNKKFWKEKKKATKRDYKELQGIVHKLIMGKLHLPNEFIEKEYEVFKELTR